MALVNEHLMKLPDKELSSEIAKRINSFQITRPKASLIHLDKNEGFHPIPASCIQAMKRAADDLSQPESFHGYCPPEGYNFLIEAVLKHEYASRGIALDSNEIFISDGATSAIGNLGDLLRHDNSIGVTAPVFSTFMNANASCGRAGTMEGNGQWSNIVYIPCEKELNFIPSLPQQRIDIVYLCLPNNPTGMVLRKEELKKWVNYALKNDTLILFDATHEAYIRQPDIPHSIYEIKGAKKVAIEIRSFSSKAGFTGVRCGFTVIPKEITAATLAGERINLNQLWRKRLRSKENGVSYISQRGAEAIYTPEGMKQVSERTAYYMENADRMRQLLKEADLYTAGGINAPFLWMEVPHRFSSWKFFEHVLYEAHVVCTPGTVFGPYGEGFVRLSAFNERTLCEEGVKRMVQSL